MDMQYTHFPDIGQAANSTAVKLPQAAAGFVGGERQLAMRLGIAQSLRGKLMAGRYHVPEPLIHQAVDIVLVHRQSLPLFATRTFGLDGDASQ
jgi:hypothetical protein